MSPLPWLGIEIRHLVALEAVARASSFRGAAEELGYVQSAISQQIAQLERLVDHRLVERTRGAKHVKLTREGELLLQHVDGIVARFRAAQADVAAVRDSSRRELRIGFFGALASRLLPPLARRFARDGGGAQLVPVDAPTDAGLFDQVEEGAVDVAFVEQPVVAGPFQHIDVFRDPWVLVVSRTSPLARVSTPPSLEEIARLPAITLNGSRSHERLQEQLALLGAPRTTTAVAEMEQTMQTFVGAGLGVAIMPRLSIDESDPRIAIVELDDVLPARTIALCWLRERKRLHGLERLCAIVPELAREFSEPAEFPRTAADWPLASAAA